MMEKAFRTFTHVIDYLKQVFRWFNLANISASVKLWPIDVRGRIVRI